MNANESDMQSITEVPKYGRLLTKNNVVEWWNDDRCIRSYVMEGNVLFCGFREWEELGQTLCVALTDCLHIYYLEENDSFVIKLPFQISNACFFKKGIILEKVAGPYSTDMGSNFENIKFVTVTDPMSAFGSIQFSTSSLDQKDLQLVHFNESEDFGISIFYQEPSKQLSFFSFQLLQENSKPVGLRSPSMTMETSKSARKKSYGNLTTNTPGSSDSMARAIQRRKTSDVPYAFDNNNLTANLRKRSAHNRRIASANWFLDDGSEGGLVANQIKLAQSPNGITSSVAKRSISSNIDRIADMTPIMINVNKGSSNDLSKDAYLTKINSVKIPALSSARKISYTKLDDQIAFSILDPINNWGKIWIFNLNYSVMADVRFKAFGYSPVSMIKAMDLKPNLVLDVSNFASDTLTGYLSFLQGNSLILYNPFYELTSPTFQLANGVWDRLYFSSSEYLILGKGTDWVRQSSPKTYPQTQSMKSIFKGLENVLACDFHLFLSLWQLELLKIGCVSPIFEIEFKALEKTILLPSEMEEKETQLPLSLQNTSWLPKVTMCLHLLREEFLLNIYESETVERLGRLLTTLTCLMNWPKVWTRYYNNKADICTSLSQSFDQPMDEPPSIFKTLYSARDQCDIPLTPFITISHLVDENTNKTAQIDDIVTPRTNKMLKLFEAITLERQSNPIQLLRKLDIDEKELESFPIGIYVPFRKLLLELENRIDGLDSNLNLELTSRTDLKMLARSLSSESRMDSMKSFIQSNFSSKSMTSKTILQILKEVTEQSLSPSKGRVKESTSELTGLTSKKAIFKQKALFEDFSRSISYSKMHFVHLPKLKLDYARLLAIKKRTATNMVYRTLTSGIGCAAAFLCSDSSLMQRHFVSESISMNFHFDLDDTMISVDRETFPDCKLQWGAFHRGVAKGLSLDTDGKDLTSSWLNFNNQDILDPGYGGFLLGLGLNGHLSVLGEWQLYNFLSPKNTFVSIGLLLGMCISMRGSMSLKMTKVLSVHVLALLPPGSSNLNIDYRIQSAGMVGLGILYENSHNRRISELFGTQLTSSIMINEESIPDEGYRLACGIAIGLINMGCGEKSVNPNIPADFEEIISAAKTKESSRTLEENLSSDTEFPFKSGTMDPKLIEKLLNIVLNVNDVAEDWMPVNSQLGAIVALMLIFLKTNYQSVADNISVAHFAEQGDSKIYVRPDIFLYTELCVNMIMWDKVPLDWRWALEVLPKESVAGNITSDVLPLYYRLAGRCLSIGIKGASSNSLALREGFCKILDMFLPMYQYSLDKRVDSQLLFKGVTSLINVIAISLSLVMSGSGDVEVYKRLRYLHSVSHGRNSYIYAMHKTGEENCFEEVEEELINAAISDKPKNTDHDNHYGKFMMTNMCMGFLFLGLGHYALRTSSIKDLSYLLISVLPTFTEPHYLQETKYLWRLAISERFLLVRDATTNEVVKDVPLLVTCTDSRKNILTYEMRSPCQLPSFERILCLQVLSPTYYPLTLKFGPKDIDIDRFFANGCCIHVKKRSVDDYGTLTKENLDRDIKLMYYKSLLQEYGNSPQKDVQKKDIFKEEQTDVDKEAEKPFFEVFCAKNVEDLELENCRHQDQEYNLNLLMNTDSNDYDLEIWRNRHIIEN